MKNFLYFHLLFIPAFITIFISFPELSYSKQNTPGSGFGRCITPEEQLKFAQHYFDDKKFDQAVTEYERFIYFFPHDPQIPHARYQMARAYFNNRQYTEAADIFRNVIQTAPRDSTRFLTAHFDLADSYQQLKEYNHAAGILDHVAHQTQDTDIKDFAYYRTGWILIENRQWESAKNFLLEISPSNLSKYQTGPLLTTLDKAVSIPQKSPALSGALSIIPGGGYLYCKRPKDALTAFLLNGGLIWAAVEAFQNDSPVLGSVITFVEVGFYGGNIYGGISSAHKYNENKIINFIDNVKQNHQIRFSINPWDSEIGITIQTPF